MIYINFYTFTKRTNSTLQPTGTGTQLSCNIKSPSSIINPVLELSSTSPISYNYCYIPAFSRYYYIDDIVYDRGLWVLSCSVDVLASFKTAIGSSSLYVLRSSTSSDPYLVDEYYPATSEVTTVNIAPALNPFTWSGFNGGVYVLGITGDNPGNVNGVTYFVMEPAQFAAMIQKFYGTNGSDPTWTARWGNLAEGVINGINNVSDFIASCRWYPVSPSVETGTRPIYLGTYNCGTGYQVANNPIVPYSVQFNNIPAHPQAASRGYYLNRAPYSSYMLSTPFTGDVKLDSYVCAKTNSITLTLTYDITTGQAKINVQDDNSQILFESYGPFGIPINLTATEVNVSGFTAGFGQLAMGVLSLNPDMALGGGAAMIGNAISNWNPAPTGNPAGGGYIGLTGDFHLRCEYLRVADDDNAKFGRPYCSTNTPATLTGYIQALDPHIAISGTDVEASQINAYAAGGFYYE